MSFHILRLRKTAVMRKDFRYDFFTLVRLINRTCDIKFYDRQRSALKISCACNVLHISEPAGYPAPRKRV